MKRWRHSLCGKVSEFPSGTNPNHGNMICDNCMIALGSWSPA